MVTQIQDLLLGRVWRECPDEKSSDDFPFGCGVRPALKLVAALGGI